MVTQKTQRQIKKASGKILTLVAGILGAGLILAALAFFILFFEGEQPAITMQHPGDYIAKTDTVSLAVSDQKSGLRHIEIHVSQGDNRKELLVKEYPRNGYTGQIGPASDAVEAPFSAPTLGFKDGDVQLSIKVQDYSLRGLLRGNATLINKTLKLDTQAPRITLLHSEQYISPGGSGIAIYRLSESAGKHGVLVNGRFYPGVAVPDGKENTYLSLFALPYDTKKVEQSVVQAADVAGNTATAAFAMAFKPVHWKQDKIPISDNFLTNKVPEFEQNYPEMKGSPVEKYLYTNNELRIANNNKIASLCAASDSKRLWQGVFHRMHGSTRAGFADHRTYTYNGQQIDQQVHLGIDLASLEHSEVKAANSGKVVFAEYLGIYGNMVLLDHGQGLFSLYSHLSQISVTPGIMVDKSSVLGLTGTTGMAAGDHLHFSMLVHGIFVTPIEWWDPHWIKVTFDEPLARTAGK